MARPWRAGRYLVFDEIATGGMATVHLARLEGVAGFGRIVAVKRLHPHLRQDPSFVAMLLDEAKIASRIYHPNVVQILDIVMEDELCLVLEYVHGESLARLVRRAHSQGQVIDASLAAALIVPVLRALHAAHETLDESGQPFGIVHRDVSPQNVLVGIDGIVKLLDFGVAKATDRLQTTSGNELKGKLPYMPPEQLRSEPLDRRVDIYAASVVLWEVLVGRRLFDGDSKAGLVHKILHEQVPRPSLEAPHLGSALDGVLAKGLARSAADRYATAEEMAIAIENQITLATPTRIAAWVQQIWNDASSRQRLVTELGRPAKEPARPAQGDEGTGSAIQLDVGDSERTMTSAGDLGTIPTAAPAVVRARVDGPPPRHARRIAAVVALGAVTALGVTGTLYLRNRQTPPPSTSAVVPPPEASSALPAATSPSSTAPPPSAPASSTSTTPRASSVAAAPPRKRPPPAPSVRPTAPNCDPPYELDEQGNHKWKRGCFKQ